MERRQYSEKEKQRILTDAANLGVKAAAEKHEMNRSVVTKWRKDRKQSKSRKPTRQQALIERANQALSSHADPLEAVLRLANGARRVEFHRIIVDRE